MKPDEIENVQVYRISKVGYKVPSCNRRREPHASSSYCKQRCHHITHLTSCLPLASHEKTKPIRPLAHTKALDPPLPPVHANSHSVHYACAQYPTPTGQHPSYSHANTPGLLLKHPPRNLTSFSPLASAPSLTSLSLRNSCPTSPISQGTFAPPASMRLPSLTTSSLSLIVRYLTSQHTSCV